MLTMLDNAKRPEDMNAPGWYLHSLTGNLVGAGQWQLAPDVRV